MHSINHYTFDKYRRVIADGIYEWSHPIIGKKWFGNYDWFLIFISDEYSGYAVKWCC